MSSGPLIYSQMPYRSCQRRVTLQKTKSPVLLRHPGLGRRAVGALSAHHTLTSHHPDSMPGHTLQAKARRRRFQAKLRPRAHQARVLSEAPHTVTPQSIGTAVTSVLHQLPAIPFIPISRISTAAPSPAVERRAVVLRRPRVPREVGWSRALPRRPFPCSCVHPVKPGASASTATSTTSPEIVLIDHFRKQKGPVP